MTKISLLQKNNVEKKSAETVNEYVIHINMYENDTETNWYTLEQVIDE